VGTSSSYGGSAGGAWSNARRAARKLAGTPTGANARRAAAAAAAALLGWEDLPTNPPQNPAAASSQVPVPTGAGPLAPRVLGIPPLVPLGSVSRGGRGGAPRPGRSGGGGSGDAPGGARIRSGNSRSPRRAAAAASRIALAGYAARDGDAAALAALGIDITALAGRTPRHQCNVILNAILDLPRTLPEQELRAACATTLIQLLTEEAPLQPVDVVRVFVANYLFEIMAVEQASAIRENGDGIAAERVLRQTVDALVARAVSTLSGTITPPDLERVIADTLERARRVVAGTP